MSFRSDFVQPNIEVFFGDKHETTEFTSQHCRLKQVHSNKVVPATTQNTLEADAHYTKQPGLHLCIVTADCLPIMLTDGVTIAAVHAGWKGLFTGILTNTIKACFTYPEKVGAFIGPHIHQKNFEFGKDTLKEYLSYQPLKKCTKAIQNNGPEKVLIDLRKLAKHELNTLGVNTVNSLNINTYTSDNHHSYRRDHKNSGRNVSWIKIKNNFN